jgi:acyl dehydratase
VLTADALRAYSRSGNFHSDPDEARRLGMPGLVAQGMQVCGPAYGVLLDEWGGAFLESGRLTARFVGMVVDGQTVEAAVVHDGERARFEVRDDAERLVAFGTARQGRDGRSAAR